MAAVNEHDDVARVREATDIVAVIGQYVALTPAGENLRGLCPFHNDTKPSFSVSPTKQVYYCFGCGEGGNVFTFVMKMEGITFAEALRKLAARAGVTLSAVGRPSAQGRARDRLRALLAAAAKFYFDNLRSGSPFARAAQDYLRQRGLKDEVVDRWQIGLALDDWDAFLRRATASGFTTDELEEAGLVVASKTGGGVHDRFRKRVIFPIRDVAGDVVAFGGRILGEGEPKYLNSPTTPLYQKSQTLYGLYENRAAIVKAGVCIIVEGYLDLIGLSQVGINNVVATCGTALTEDAAAMLTRYAQDFIILFDGDAAGERAARRGAPELLKRGGRVRVSVLTDGNDPFDAAVTGTAPDALATAKDWVDFAASVVKREAAGDAVAAARAAAREIWPVLAAVPDEITRRMWRKRLAACLAVTEDSFTLPTVKPAPGSCASGSPSPEVELLRILIQNPECVGEALAGLDLEEVTDDRVREVLRVIGKLSRRGAFTAAALADELDEPDRKFISSLALTELPVADPAAAAALAVEGIRRRSFVRRLREMRARLASGDAGISADELRHLVEEKRKYSRKPGCGEK